MNATITKEKDNVQNLKLQNLQKAYENNIKISNKKLSDKFRSFEQWEYRKSCRLLYEIENPKKTYRRYPRGKLVKVDFGVNIGGEFSEQHFAITLTKQDNQYNSTITVVPLSSKPHKAYLLLGTIFKPHHFSHIRNELTHLLLYNENQENNLIKKLHITKDKYDYIVKLWRQFENSEIENLPKNLLTPKQISILDEEENESKSINQFQKNIALKIKKIVEYYMKVGNNFTYANIKQIRTISKLNILPVINEYDIIDKVICPKKIMNKIDKEIVRNYTSIDYPLFEKWYSDNSNLTK